MALFVVTLIFYFALTIPFYPFIAWLKLERVRGLLVLALQNYCRFGLWFMGVKVSVKDTLKIRENFNSGLIVCNHLSYIDVLILFAYFPACFVTSVEIRRTPFLGQLCLLAGCLFVERRSRENLTQEISQLSTALKAGLNVTIFPEATSTNGEAVIRFRRPLFQAAIDAQVPALCLSLNYRSLDDEPMTPKNRDQVFWYDDMTFVDHLWGFFTLREVRVEIVISELISSAQQTKEELCDLAYDSVKKNYTGIL